MALISIELAKQHLRVTSDARNDDLMLKAEQATDIILDYLKSRAHNVVTIETSSVASPTVITTEEAHGFSNGNTVTIAGHEDSAPDLNGSWTISSVTSDTFTIPVAVTTGGTGGSATVAWTELTVPTPVQAAILIMLAYLDAPGRGDALEPARDPWLTIERLLVRMRDPALA